MHGLARHGKKWSFLADFDLFGKKPPKNLKYGKLLGILLEDSMANDLANFQLKCMIYELFRPKNVISPEVDFSTE